MPRKIVNWCRLRQFYFVWDRQLMVERGWFFNKREADLCASQLELF